MSLTGWPDRSCRRGGCRLRGEQLPAAGSVFINGMMREGGLRRGEFSWRAVSLKAGPRFVE